MTLQILRLSFWRRALVTGVSVAIGALFAFSAASKLLDFAGFRRIVQFTTGVRTTMASRIAGGVVAAEFIAATVAFGPALATGALIALLGIGASLIIVFTTWVVVVLHRRMAVTCSCFGSSKTAVSWRTLARNLAILGAIVLDSVVAASQPGRLTDRSQHAVIAATALLLCVTLAAYRFVRPHLLTSAHMRALADGVEI